MGCWFQRRWRTAAWVLMIGIALGLAEPQIAPAHEGPPFPIVVDEPLAGLVISVWADPDVGDGVFYLVVESPKGGSPDAEPRVAVWVEPVSGRLERVRYEASRQALRNQMQFVARPAFDQRDIWNVGFQLTTADGKSAELIRQIESTPPGFGLWDFAIYLFPFVLLGGMWALAMLRRSRTRVADPSVADPSVAGPSVAGPSVAGPSVGELSGNHESLDCHEVKNKA